MLLTSKIALLLNLKERFYRSCRRLQFAWRADVPPDHDKGRSINNDHFHILHLLVSIHLSFANCMK